MAESADPMELAGQIAPRYTEDGLWVARCAHDTTIDMFDGPQASSRSPWDRGMTEADAKMWRPFDSDLDPPLNRVADCCGGSVPLSLSRPCSAYLRARRVCAVAVRLGIDVP